LRLSRSFRQVDSPSASERERIPLRRVVLWLVVALAVVLGIVLYFAYAQRVATLIV
jgi:type VI protein secretion system component VasF